eukprot:m.277569 g.277569  ORF g.277569 m.277569 type:complete len:511 (+) comp16308_c0_seq9:386-1918(+)
MTGFALLRVHMLLCLSDMQSVPKQGLELWLSAHDLALRRLSEGKSSEPVEIWPDISGHGRHAINKNAAFPVTFTNNYDNRNGVPAVHFAQGETMLTVPAINIPELSARTIIFAASKDELVEGAELIGNNIGRIVSLGCYASRQLRLRDKFQRIAREGVWAKKPLSDKQVYVVTIIVTAELETSVFINGVREDIVASTRIGCVVSGTYRPTITGRIVSWSMNETFFVGGVEHHLTGKRGLRGHIAEMLIYSKALNDSERRQAESHVNYVLQNAPTSSTTTTTTTTLTTTTTTITSVTTTITLTSVTTTTTPVTTVTTTTTSNTQTTFTRTSTSVATTNSITTFTTSQTTPTTPLSSANSVSTQTATTQTTSITTRTLTPRATKEEGSSSVLIAVIIGSGIFICFLVAIFVYKSCKKSNTSPSRRDIVMENPVYGHHDKAQDNTQPMYESITSDDLSDAKDVQGAQDKTQPEYETITYDDMNEQRAQEYASPHGAALYSEPNNDEVNADLYV